MSHAEIIEQAAQVLSTLTTCDGPMFLPRVDLSEKSRQMTDIQAWLDQGKTLTDQATEGPWEARSSEVTMNDRSEWKIGKHNHPQVLRSVMRGADAEFIADARTRLPQALAAIQTVLDLHRPEEYDGYPHGADGVGCSVCLTEYDEYAEWPCPTVQAIQNALGTDA